MFLNFEYLIKNEILIFLIIINYYLLGNKFPELHILDKYLFIVSFTFSPLVNFLNVE